MIRVRNMNHGFRASRVGRRPDGDGAGMAFRAVLLVVSALLFLAAPASAALPPPNFMPGFPMVAGPQVIFMWGPVGGAEKYRIYQNGKPVAEMAAFQHVMPLPADGEHVFYVVAVDKEGKESPPGKEFRYAVQKLEAPKNLATLVRGDKIGVRWDAAKGALVYDIQRGSSPAGPFQLVSSTQDLLYTDSNVKPGESYYYRVASKDASGAVSEFSVPVLGKVEAAAAEAKSILKIIKTKMEWEVKGIEYVDEALYLPGRTIIGVSMGGNLGPTLHIVENADDEKEMKRTVIPLPEDRKEARFGAMGLSAKGSVWVVSNLTPDIFRVDPSEKKIVGTITVEPLPKTETPYNFVDVAEGPGGELYVVEQKNDAVMVIRGGKIVSMFGKKGRGAGEFVNPSYILIADGKIFVADSVQCNISIFTLDGKFVKRFGSLGGRDAGTFNHLTGIAVDTKNKWLFAADRATSTIQVFDFEGKFVAMLSNEDGTGSPKTNPVGLDYRDGNLLVSWQNGNKVQNFRFLGPPEDRK